jgi:hypothetical protein
VRLVLTRSVAGRSLPKNVNVTLFLVNLFRCLAIAFVVRFAWILPKKVNVTLFSEL